MRNLCVVEAGSEGRFEKQWKWIPELRRLENAQHDAAIQVIDAVDTSTGEVAYEGIALESRRGELHVVIREDDACVGFVHHRLFRVIPPEVAAKEFARDPDQIFGVFMYETGIDEYETSHGLTSISLQEVLEEMGLAIVASESIGFVHAIPPLGGAPHELFAVMVGREASDVSPETNEEINHVRFFPPEEVRNIPTL